MEVSLSGTRDLMGDDRRVSLLWTAFQEFRDSLESDEKTNFTSATPSDVLECLKAMDEKHRRGSTCRKALDAFYPLIQFLDRHSRAIDCLVQIQPSPSSLIWAVCRIILETAVSFRTYFIKLLSMVERLSRSLALWQEYEQMLGDCPRFEVALVATYHHTLLFINKARAVFKKKGLKLFIRSAWNTFDSDFGHILETVSAHTAVLQEEITLAFRQKLHSKLGQAIRGQQSSKKVDFESEDNFDLRRKITKWLSPLDMESVLIRNSQSRCPGSGEWFLSSGYFDSWLSSSETRGLWVTGPPGYGKTILACNAIERTKQRTATNSDTHAVFFFCHGQVQEGPGSPSLSTVFATLIWQLAVEQPQFPLALMSAFHAAQRHGRSTISLVDNPISLFRDIVREGTCNMFILIDAPDAFNEAGPLVHSLAQLIMEVPHLRLLVFSRPAPVLVGCLSKFTRLHLTPALVRQDIELFINLQLDTMEFEEDGLRRVAAGKLFGKSRGMFLWAKLMVHTLKTATSPRAMLEILGQSPAGLGELYTSLLDGIARQPDSLLRLARMTLLWTCYAARPLTWPELQCALAFDPRGIFQPSYKPFKTAILASCSSLLEYLPASDSFQPIHASAVEYIIENSEHAAEAASNASWISKFRHSAERIHLDMARACLQCIRANASPVGLLFDEIEPFTEYAVQFWCWHLGKAAYSPALYQQVRGLLENPANRQAWITRFLFSRPSRFPLQCGIKQAKALTDWLRKAGVGDSSDLVGNWIQDTQEIFLSSRPSSRAVSISGSPHGETVMKISYFTKLMVIRDLSRELTMSGRLGEGVVHFEAALKAQQEQLGGQDISCAILLNSLGIIYDQQGRCHLATEIQEQALSIQESCLGQEHLETVWTVNELGRMYRHLGILESAETMHLRALDSLLRVLPRTDLQIAWTLNTLGRTLRKQGRYAEAASMHEEALEIQKSALGEKHPHRLWALMDLAACLRGQGRLRESAALYADALEGRVEALSARHADTLWAMNNLGLVLEDLGDLAGALEMQKEALQGQKSWLGVSHKHTSWTREAIGRLERRMANCMSE